MTLLQDVLKSPNYEVKEPQAFRKEGVYFTKDRLLGQNGLTAAERFLFEECPAGIVGDLIESGSLDPKLMSESIHLPYPVMWVEWPALTEGDRKVKVGVLIDCEVFSSSEFDLKTGVWCWAKSHDIPYIEGIWSMEEFPIKVRPDGIGLGCRANIAWGSHKILQGFMWHMFSALFLLTTPRISEIEQVTHSAKFQAARIKRGKPPLVEYKKVTVHLGKAAKQFRGYQRQPGETEEEHRKRLHQVIGHFRTYRKNRETPKISWVPPHWRGDPEKGLLMHERKIVK